MRYTKKTMINALSDQVTRALQNVLLTRNITQSKLHRLEEDMKNILERPDLPDDTKVSLYQQALQQYLQCEHARKTEPVSVKMSTSRPPDGSDDMSDTLDAPSGKTRGETRGGVTSKDDLTPQILESVPKTLHRRAKLVLLNKL